MGCAVAVRCEPRLACLLGTEFRHFLTEPWRREPLQPRALRTVEALLLTTDRLFRQHGLAGVNLEQVAREAYVTPQAAYRYFESTDQLLRAAVRYQHARMTTALGRRISARRFTAIEEVAQAMVAEATTIFDAVVAQYPADWLVVYRRHHEVFYDGFAATSEVRKMVMVRDGLAGMDSSLPGLAAGLAGMFGTLKMLRREDPRLAQQAEMRRMVAANFAAALANALPSQTKATPEGAGSRSGVILERGASPRHDGDICTLRLHRLAG